MKLVKFGLVSLVLAMTSVWAAEYHGAWLKNAVGNWENEDFTGKASEEWPYVFKYIGEFNDGKYHSRGFKYSAIGSIQESGIFKDKKLVTLQYIDPNSFTPIKRNIIEPGVTNVQSKRTFTLEKAYGMPAAPVATTKKNNLQACQGSNMSRWNNCIGTWTAPNGDKFIGKFINGKSNG